MTRRLAGPSRGRSRARAARAFVLVAVSVGRPPLALAQTPRPAAPADLPLRDANFAWDGSLLRASFSFVDVLEDAGVRSKLANGTENTIAMRAYVLRDGETNPVMLVVQRCSVTYNLWNDVYQLQIETATGTTQRSVLNLDGVARYCARVQDFPIATRASLRASAAHFLGIIVDVNPVSDEIRGQMQRWMRRPLGSSDVGGGNAVFSGLVLLFMRDVGGSDRTLSFRTRTFVP